jgi:hypothetical protein
LVYTPEWGLVVRQRRAHVHQAFHYVGGCLSRVCRGTRGRQAISEGGSLCLCVQHCGSVVACMLVVYNEHRRVAAHMARTSVLHSSNAIESGVWPVRGSVAVSGAPSSTAFSVAPTSPARTAAKRACCNCTACAAPAVAAAPAGGMFKRPLTRSNLAARRKCREGGAGGRCFLSCGVGCVRRCVCGVCG